MFSNFSRMPEFPKLTSDKPKKDLPKKFDFKGEKKILPRLKPSKFPTGRL